ncbi:hypothetical protein CAPTEDRAFT_207117 [Capitella teleta]|uniref:Uncharacterized protein n=1 Tax=Capitella teleta TaxID=283909 RepID=R7V763_CAPTE|nr:hypothetical protein CAPTEDRAFT_207117 [Capitella teleta]|eukprot:ELU14419.1 hypothetical protein CAPTEDRAFT_207117 [Capitella teleta]
MIHLLDLIATDAGVQAQSSQVTQEQVRPHERMHSAPHCDQLHAGIFQTFTQNSKNRRVVEFNKLHRIPLSKPCETSSISICERYSKLEARMAANENLCAENNCCIAGKSPARPSTERPISQPATHHHNDANKTHERTKQNQRSLKTQEQTWAAIAKNAVYTVNDNEGFTKITNVSPVVTTNKLKEYVLAKEGSLSSISIEDNTGDGWETKRFVLTIPRSAETTVLDPEFWPSDIFIRKGFKPRKPKSAKEAASVPSA